jgi:hypothetical protein
MTNPEEYKAAAPTTKDDVIGYKKPPKRCQFKPGQSGNPKGRPKGSVSRGKIFEKQMNTKVPILMNGKRIALPYRDLIMLSTIRLAAKGSVPHIKLVEALAEKYDSDRPQDFEKEIRIVFVKPPVYPPDDELGAPS